MSFRVLVLVWSFFFWGALAQDGNTAEPYRLRLVGGDARCRGELQIQRTDQDWTGVRPWFISLPIGHMFCEAVDCGSALSVVRKTVEERDAVPLSPRCDGTSLTNCFKDSTRRSDTSLELSCTDSVRLVSGQTSCSGSLQIRAQSSAQSLAQSSAQSWTPVCEGALDRRGAEVLCRELGCGAPLLQGALSSPEPMFRCTGHESALMDCPWNQTRTCSKPAFSVTCSEPLRLVGGASRCAGTLEVKHRGQWRRVESSDRWDLGAAAGVCRRLDCGFAVSTDERRDFEWSDVWDVTPDCVRKNAEVGDCVKAGHSRRFQGQEVVCSDSVRLVGGRSLCSGYLQVPDQSLAQSWTPVCEGALDRRGAEVLCRELGCGAPLLQGALSPLGQTFLCEGHESALMDCPRNQTRTEPGTCRAHHITCSAPVRLVGGASRCQGTVEVNHRGEWRRLWTPFNPWTLEAVAAVCRGLDCGSAIYTEKKRGFKKSRVWSVRLDCMKSDTAVKDCVYGEFTSHKEGLDLECSDSVRLVGGRSLCSGSLQILDQSLSQSWTPVCEGALDRRGAEVLCRELGCGAPLLQGALSPLEQTFLCEGHESALMDCPRNQTRTEPGTCSPLHLTCSVMRLVGGPSRCEGVLELRHGEQWGRVAPPTGFPWDLAAAAVACRDLGCGSAAAVRERLDLRRTDQWVVRADCVVRKAALSDCVQPGFYGNDGLKVVCSGLQGAPEATQTGP